jgi:hypothetical protein
MAKAMNVLEGIEIPRAGLARYVLGLLPDGSQSRSAAGLVHAFGPYSFGKQDFAAALEAMATKAGRPVVRIDLSHSANQTETMIVERSVIDRVVQALGAPSSPWRGADAVTGALGAEAVRCLVELCQGRRSRPLILVEHTESILTSERIAPSFFHGIAQEMWGGILPFDLVTLANFPLDLLMGEATLPRGWRQVVLRSFPVPAKASGLEQVFGFRAAIAAADDDAAARDKEASEDVAAWIDARCHANWNGERLKRLTPELAGQLRDLVVQKTSGHPALTMLLLKRTLEDFDEARGLNEFLEAETAVWGQRMAEYRAALFPEIESPISYTDALTRKISKSLVELRALKVANENPLSAGEDAEMLRWWTGLGLIVNRSTMEKPDWKWAAPYFERWTEASWLSDCVERLNAHARHYEDIRRNHADQDDPYIDDVQQKVFEFFCDTENGRKLGYQLDDAKRHVVERQLHYRFELTRELSQDAKSRGATPKSRGARASRVSQTVHVFRNLTEAGEQLWMQHYGVLRRLSTLQSPALPQIFSGGRIADRTGDGTDERALGYLLLSVEGQPLISDYRRVLSELRNPGDADEGAPAMVVRQAAELCRALSLLHAHGIAHRRIDLTAIRFSGEFVEPVKLVLSGFEFALVLGTILRAAPGSHDVRVQRRTDVNLFFSGRGALLPRLAYPGEPERLMTSWLDSDIHAMGVLLAFLFAGPPDEAEARQLLDALPQAPITDEELEQACDRFQEDKRKFLTDQARWDRAAEGHPECYRELLVDMRGLVDKCVSLKPDARFTSGDLHRQVSWLRSEYERQLLDRDRRFALVFDVEHMGEKLVDMNLLDGDTRTAEGRARIRFEIENWLATAAWLHFRDEGFSGSGGKASARNKIAAKYLIVCDQVVFFAAYYRRYSTQETDPKLLRLAFTVYRGELRLPILAEEEYVKVPSNIDVFASDEIDAIPLEAYASWQPLLDQVEDVENRYASPDTRLAAASWEFHRTLGLSAERVKQFPVKVRKTGNQAELRLDGERFSDSLKGHGGFFYKLLLNDKDRMTFFLDTVAAWHDETEAGGRKLLFVRQGAVFPRRFDLEVIGVETDHVKVYGNELLTDGGTLFFTDFYGTQSASTRQRDAISGLIRNRDLFDHLRRPRRDAPALLPISALCGKDLGQASRKVIQNLKSGSPISALQGPPGTGKTTIVAQLVAELLRDDENLRILITSQSHAAVDTTMKKILDTLEDQPDRDRGQDKEEKTKPDAIRIVPRTNPDRVSEVMQQSHTSVAITKRKLDLMRKDADKYLEENRTGPEGMRRAYEALRRASGVSTYELRKRIERSAPLVFGTTAASQAAQDFLRSPIVSYDIVIVEEAAKAWGIDLVQPLSVGDRVVMVGDHKQLPPFDNERVLELFRQALARSLDDRPKEALPEDVAYICHSRNFDEALAWLTPFRRLFDSADRAASRRSGDETADAADAGAQAIPVTQTLRIQHRSLEPIGRLVSTAFYNGDVDTADGLKAIPRDLPLTLTVDGKLIAPVLAWIDTSKLPEDKYGVAADRPGKLMNPGEAEIVSKLLSGYSYSDQNGTDPEVSCRIMAPYARQVGEIRSRFRQDYLRLGVDSYAKLDRIIQTIDSTQGAEADLVVVSMTRSRRIVVPAEGEQAENWERALRRYFGFLRSSERMNVMFSRARKQLFIVGNFDYFSAFDRLAKGWTDAIKDPVERRQQHEKLGFWGKLIAAFPREADTSNAQVMRIDAAEILGRVP